MKRLIPYPRFSRNNQTDRPGFSAEAVPIPHTTTRALPTPTPTAAVHTRTVRGRPRAAGTERFLGMLPSVSQAFLPPKTPNFDQISPKRAPKSAHGGLGRPPEPERGPPAPTRATPTRAGAWVGRRAYKYGAPVGCAGGLSLDECANSRMGESLYNLRRNIHWFYPPFWVSALMWHTSRRC